MCLCYEILKRKGIIEAKGIKKKINLYMISSELIKWIELEIE